MHRMMMAAALFLGASLTACGGMENEPAGTVVPEELGQSKDLLWTGYTSEEYPPVTCGTTSLVNGFECTGSYCDNLTINCTTAGVTHGNSSFTSSFSEEGTNWRECGANEWVTGIMCSGSYCDNVSLECTYIPNRTVGSCYWSSAYTDGSGPLNLGAGYYIRGAKCTGKYCDNMSFLYCRLN